MENNKVKVEEAIASIKSVLGDTFEAVNKFSNTKIGLAIYVGLIWKFFGQEVWRDVFKPAVQRLAFWIKVVLAILTFKWLVGFGWMGIIITGISSIPTYLMSCPEQTRIPLVVVTTILLIMTLGLISRVLTVFKS